MLLVPGGRSVPAAFDRSSGEFRYFKFNEGGKGTGGSFLAADDENYYVHTRLKGTRAFDLKAGAKTAFVVNEPVLSDGLIYASVGDESKPQLRAYGSDKKALWEISADGTGDLIRCGKHLIAAGKQAITAISLPQSGKSKAPQIDWTIPVEGTVQRLLVANGQLFAVTLEGNILCFGSDTGSNAKPTIHAQQKPQSIAFKPEAAETVSQMLSVGDAEGYAFWYGAASDEILNTLAANSPFVQLAVVDKNEDRIGRLQKKLNDAKLYGRVTVHHSEPAEFMPPKNVAHMVFVGQDLTATVDSAAIAEMYEAVRPYGGVLYFLGDEHRSRI